MCKTHTPPSTVCFTGLSGRPLSDMRQHIYSCPHLCCDRMRPLILSGFPVVRADAGVAASIIPYPSTLFKYFGDLRHAPAHCHRHILTASRPHTSPALLLDGAQSPALFPISPLARSILTRTRSAISLSLNFCLATPSLIAATPTATASRTYISASSCLLYTSDAADE